LPFLLLQIILLRVAEVIHELVSGTSLLNQVMIVATALNVKSLHPILNHLESNHFFTCELQIPPLTKVYLKKVLFQTSNLNKSLIQLLGNEDGNPYNRFEK